MMMLSISILLASTSLVVGQRPPFAGTRPIGYPDTPNRTTTEGLGDRFGEGTTERLPIEANGDRDLIDRLSKLPIDKQPFWFINWQALEAHRNKPQTYPQRPNVFIDPITSNLGNRFSSTGFNTPKPNSTAFNSTNFKSENASSNVSNSEFNTRNTEFAINTGIPNSNSSNDIANRFGIPNSNLQHNYTGNTNVQGALNSKTQINGTKISDYYSGNVSSNISNLAFNNRNTAFDINTGIPNSNSSNANIANRFGIPNSNLQQNYSGNTNVQGAVNSKSQINVTKITDSYVQQANYSQLRLMRFIKTLYLI